jgi:hypothetical protein
MISVSSLSSLIKFKLQYKHDLFEAKKGSLYIETKILNYFTAQNDDDIPYFI